MLQTTIRVGILTEKEISFSFDETYICGGIKLSPKITYSAHFDNGKILFQGILYDELLFETIAENAVFNLHEVTIGVSFHWERKITQSFPGKLHLIIHNEQIIAINIVLVEDYLISVISSEMSSTASLEFLKAHAVISRSWLLAQIEKNKTINVKTTYASCIQNEDEYIRWYDREDHELFDVCADDHCQRYQGFSHILSPLAREAVNETSGNVLVYDGKICDARFSKCCGGVTEEFQYCWEPIKHPYLKAISDKKDKNSNSFPDLTQEENAARWIQSSPGAFCNTSDSAILSQVLNNYDLETTDFYRWKIEYSQQELAALIFERSGFDFGEIIDLMPIERGKSGRLVKLKVVGSKKSLTIGKELEIRRILSRSHLYSSAFVVDKQNYINAIPQTFILTGAGWGHGVGLCQIGAAVMGEKGYRYDEILYHYFSGATIEKKY